jgi:hypothetical protein
MEIGVRVSAALAGIAYFGFLAPQSASSQE